MLFDSDWNLNDSLNRNLNFDVLIDVNLDIPGHFNLSYDSLLIGNLDLLDDFDLLVDVSLNRYLDYFVHKDWNVDIFMNDFFDVLLDWVGNVDCFLYWDLSDLVNVDLFVDVFGHWDLVVSLDDFLDIIGNLDHFVDIDGFIYDHLIWNFDYLLVFDLFFDLDYPWDFDKNVLELVKGNINDRLVLFLEILGHFVLDFLLDQNLSIYRDLNNDLIFDDLGLVGSHDETVMGLLNDFFPWDWDLLDVLFGHVYHDVDFPLDVLVDIDSLLDLSVAFSLNDFLDVDVFWLFDVLLDDVVDIVAILDDVLDGSLDDDFLWFLDDSLYCYGDFLDQLEFLSGLIWLILVHYNKLLELLEFYF